MSTVNKCTKKDTCTSTDDKGESITGSGSVSREAILRFLEEHSRGLPVDVEQLKVLVEHITKSIRKFKDKEDIDVLLGLKDLCGESNLPIYAAIMNRNIAMHHFYRNDIDTAVELLYKTITFLEKYEEVNLIFSCYSDLGLIYFCDGECTKSKESLSKAQGLLPHTSDVDNFVMHLYNYRWGSLYSHMLELELARQFFNNAEKYAVNCTQQGNAVMNIGLTYKREGNYERALEYYTKALNIYEESDYIDRSVIYNNTAEIYKILGQYDKALEYINKAFEHIDEKNMDFYFVYFETYTEIRIFMREPEVIIDKFFNLLSNIKDHVVYRKNIIQQINNIAMASCENMDMLERLEKAVIKLIKDTAKGKYEYKLELNKCLKKIECYKSEMSNYKGRYPL